MTNIQVNEEINKIKEVLVKKYKPNKIILFGSHAWGKPHKDSDLDFFIIKNVRIKRPVREQNVYKVLSRYYSERQLPIDIIVHTQSETDKRLALGDPFIKEVLNRGQIIYEHSQ